jgi:molybdopterin molybdotransferase
MMMGYTAPSYGVMAYLSEAIPSNHGREEYIAVYLGRQNGVWSAQPVRGKSGLITTLTKANGYICIPRDCEGRASGQEVKVFLF